MASKFSTLNKMDSKTTDLLYTFDLADLRFFLLIANHKNYNQQFVDIIVLSSNL